jgi:hypothetical protein
MEGWLGSMSVEAWLAAAHGEARIDCHTLKGPQCAGAAIYRANVGKLPRDRDLLRLPSDRVTVFATRPEFVEYHASAANARKLREAPVRMVRQSTRGVCPACGAETDALSAMYHPGVGCRRAKKPRKKA